MSINKEKVQELLQLRPITRWKFNLQKGCVRKRPYLLNTKRDFFWKLILEINKLHKEIGL